MDTYVILRRNGWRRPRRTSKRPASNRARVADEEMPEDIRWIRSYALAEEDGTIGTVCIYQAIEPGGDPRARRTRRDAGDRDHPGGRHGDRPARPRGRSGL